LGTIGDLGGSVLTNGHPRTGREYALWLGDLFDGHGLGQAGVIGSSKGSWIAHSFALCAPERVRKLVLLAPAAGIPPSDPVGIHVALIGE
jgi:pimeloyl-ACP methyl ester carboxylesterase